jgi:hypothetical protein
MFLLQKVCQEKSQIGSEAITCCIASKLKIISPPAPVVTPSLSLVIEGAGTPKNHGNHCRSDFPTHCYCSNYQTLLSSWTYRLTNLGHCPFFWTLYAAPSSAETPLQLSGAGLPEKKKYDHQTITCGINRHVE